MKKVYFLLFILTLLLIAFNACKNEQETTDIFVGNGTNDEIMVSSSAPIKNGKWLNADTLRIKAEGSINEESFEMPAVKKREMACNAAKLAAMSIAVDILGDSKSDSVFDVQRETTNGTRHFSAFIKGGSVIQQSFDKSSNKCTVIYELKEKNLQKKAVTGLK